MPDLGGLRSKIESEAASGVGHGDAMLSEIRMLDYLNGIEPITVESLRERYALLGRMRLGPNASKADAAYYRGRIEAKQSVIVRVAKLFE